MCNGRTDPLLLRYSSDAHPAAVATGIESHRKPLAQADLHRSSRLIDLQKLCLEGVSSLYQVFSAFGLQSVSFGIP